MKLNPEKFSENCKNMYDKVLGCIASRVPSKKWVQFDSKEVLLVDEVGETDELIGEVNSV